jgi:hypothetical protein
MRLVKNGFSVFTSLAMIMPPSFNLQGEYMPDLKRCQQLRMGILGDVP